MRVYNSDWSWFAYKDLFIGESWAFAQPIVDYTVLVGVVPLFECLTDEQKVIVENSVNTRIAITYQDSFSSDPASFASYNGYVRLRYCYNDLDY